MGATCGLMDKQLQIVLAHCQQDYMQVRKGIPWLIALRVGGAYLGAAHSRVAGLVWGPRQSQMKAILSAEEIQAWLRRDDQNPIDGMLWSFYNSGANDALLSYYPISFHWSDIFALANLRYGFIIQGIINALYNNTRY